MRTLQRGPNTSDSSPISINAQNSSYATVSDLNRELKAYKLEKPSCTLCAFDLHNDSHKADENTTGKWILRGPDVFVSSQIFKSSYVGMQNGRHGLKCLRLQVAMWNHRD